MGTTLTGTTPQDTYDSLIKVTDNGPLSGTAKYLSDGLGNNLPIAVSTSKVGIGTSAPATTLHVSDAAATTATFNSTFGQLAITFANNGTGFAQIGSGVAVTPTGTATDLGFGTAGSASTNIVFATGASFVERMRITSAGNAQFGDGNNFTPVIQYAGSGRVAASPAYSFLGDLDTGMFNPNLGNTIAFATAATERMRIAADGEVSVGSTNTQARFNVSQTSAARITGLTGNNNDQGSAQNYRVVRHYPVVSLGTKLIIPFVSQGSLNSNTILRIFGHSARYNNNGALGFTADIAVGHLGTILATTTLSSTGNILLIASSGSNLEITFTTDYTGAVGNGIYVTLEYMTNNAGFSIDVANIAMN